MSARLPSASFTALTISVDCPACGESLPDPSGSLFWTPQELARVIAEQPNRTCDSCEEPYVLRQQSKAQLYLEIVRKDDIAMCLQCSQPLHTEEPLTFIDNSNPGRGGCHARCVDAYFAQKRAAEGS